MSEECNTPLCQCVKRGACQVVPPAELRRKQIENAVGFLEKTRSLGQDEQIFRDGRFREATILDLLPEGFELTPEEKRTYLPPGEQRRMMLLALDAADGGDPLLSAQRAQDERYGLGPVKATTERARAFVEGWDPDDPLAAQARRVNGGSK